MGSTTFSGPVNSTDGFVSGATGLGNLTGNWLVPTSTVAAIGTTQANASTLVQGFNLVTGADATVGVRLPLASAGQVLIIKNASASALKLWPGVGDGINAVTVDAFMSIGAQTCFMIVAYDATTWYTLPLVPS